MPIDDGLIVSSEKREWDFPVAKTLKVCGYCGRRAGFHDEVVGFCNEREDGDDYFKVRVCNHCGEYNGEVSE